MCILFLLLCFQFAGQVIFMSNSSRVLGKVKDTGKFKSVQLGSKILSSVFFLRKECGNLSVWGFPLLPFSTVPFFLVSVNNWKGNFPIAFVASKHSYWTEITELTSDVENNTGIGCVRVTKANKSVGRIMYLRKQDLKTEEFGKAWELVFKLVLELCLTIFFKFLA